MASNFLNFDASSVEVLSVAVRESDGAALTEKVADAPPARLVRAARAASMSVGPTARATSRTMSLGGEIAKDACPYAFLQPRSCQNKLVAGLRGGQIVATLLADEVQPVAVAALALLLAAGIPVGALDHVGARGRRDDGAGFLAGR